MIYWYVVAYFGLPHVTCLNFSQNDFGSSGVTCVVLPKEYPTLQPCFDSG